MNATSAAAAEESCSEGMTITEVGDAQKGTNPNEVVLGVAPAFGVSQTTNIVGIPHAAIIKEIMAGLEEEGVACRIVKIYRTSLTYPLSLMMQQSYLDQALVSVSSPKVQL